MPAEKRDRKVSQNGRERMRLHAMLPDKTRVHAAEDELGGEQQCLRAKHMGATVPTNAHPCGDACGGSAFGDGSYR